MKNRLKSLQKILRLQSKLHQLATWKLAAIDQEHAALEAAQRELIDVVDRQSLQGGALLAGATRRLRKIDGQIANAKADRQMQAVRVLDQGTRAKLAERLVERTDANQRADEDRKELLDLIERSLSDKTSSSA